MLQNKGIATIGFGELGRQIELLLEARQGMAFSAYFDDLVKDKVENALPFKDYINYLEEFKFIVSLGYKNFNAKEKLINELDEKGALAEAIISENCYLAQTSQVGKAAVLYPGCNIDKEVVIGKGCLLNNGVIVSHNSIIGDNSYLSPGVVLSGNVEIGKNSFVGSGTIVANGVKIGNDCILGVGSVITRDVKDGSSVIGNPMKVLNKSLNLL